MLIEVMLRTLRTLISTMEMRTTFVMVTTLKTVSPVILIHQILTIPMMMKMAKEIQEKEKKHQLRVSNQQPRRQLKIFLNNQSKSDRRTNKL